MFITSAFYETNCYLSFVKHRGLGALAKAHEAKDNATRFQILDPLRGIHGMPSGISDAIECALTLFDDGLTLGDRAYFMLGKGDQAIKMAVHWDATGPVGAAAKLVSTTPDLAAVAYSQLEVAARAIIDEGMVQQLPSPLLKSAVLFIEAVDPRGADSDSRGWAVNIAAECLSIRLGTKPLDATADPTTIPEERANEVYKKVKEFLGNVPKSIPLPQWFLDWKAQMDAKKKALEAAEAGKQAETKRLLKATTSAENKALKHAAEAAAPSAPSAAAAEAASTTPTPPQPQPQPQPEGEFVTGSKVKIFGGKGGKRAVTGTGKVDNVCSRHCWVQIDATSGVDGGIRKRIEKTKLELVNDNPPPPPQAQSSGSDAQPPADQAQPDADADAHAAAEDNAWQACSDVFT